MSKKRKELIDSTRIAQEEYGVNKKFSEAFRKACEALEESGCSYHIVASEKLTLEEIKKRIAADAPQQHLCASRFHGPAYQKAALIATMIRTARSLLSRSNPLLVLSVMSLLKDDANDEVVDLLAQTELQNLSVGTDGKLARNQSKRGDKDA